MPVDAAVAVCGNGWGGGWLTGGSGSIWIQCWGVGQNGSSRGIYPEMYQAVTRHPLGATCRDGVVAAGWAG